MLCQREGFGFSYIFCGAAMTPSVMGLIAVFLVVDIFLVVIFIRERSNLEAGTLVSSYPAKSGASIKMNNRLWIKLQKAIQTEKDLLECYLVFEPAMTFFGRIYQIIDAKTLTPVGNIRKPNKGQAIVELENFRLVFDQKTLKDTFVSTSQGLPVANVNSSNFGNLVFEAKTESGYYAKGLVKRSGGGPKTIDIFLGTGQKVAEYTWKLNGAWNRIEFVKMRSSLPHELKLIVLDRVTINL